MDEEPKTAQMQMEADPRFIKKFLQDAFTADLKNIEACLKKFPESGEIRTSDPAYYEGLKDAAQRYMSLLTNLGLL